MFTAIVYLAAVIITGDYNGWLLMLPVILDVALISKIMDGVK